MYANLLDARLVSPAIELYPNSRLSFQHKLQGEVSGAYPDSAYDGGLLEISLDGLNWSQLTPASGRFWGLVESGSQPCGFGAARRPAWRS